MPGLAGVPGGDGRRAAALESVSRHDPRWPASVVAALLGREENAGLLEYVSEDAFTHVFPGDRPGYPPGQTRPGTFSPQTALAPGRRPRRPPGA